MTGQSPKLRHTGTVGFCHTSETGRFAATTLAMARLELPAGWSVMGAGNYDEAHARNFLADQFEGDYLWFIDDDHDFNPDILKRLLRHDVEVVAPLVCQRRPPFAPVAIRDGQHLQLSREGTGLVEVDLTGTAGMLIHRHVFDDLDQPWFEHRDLPDGTHEPSDTNFCRKLQEANIPVHVDLGVCMGHLNTVEVRPHHDGIRWHTVFAVGREPIMDIAHNPVPARHLEVVR